MQSKNQKILSGWGNFPIKQCEVFRPERQKDVADIYMEHGATLVARGAGKSYGDAALNREGVILSDRLNKFLGFNAERGIVNVQPGVTLAEILSASIAEGWFLPVIPGTKYASAGGCFAANVHGKNEYKQGEFAANVLNLKLRLPNRELVHCSEDTNSELYWATAGGMGMTGFIEEIALRLMPISSTKMKVDKVRVDNIEEMAERMRKGVGNSEYMVGWIDHFGSGKNLGQGIFERASHVKKTEPALANYKAKEPGLCVPFNLPGFVLNRYSMKLYNQMRFAGIGYSTKSNIKNFEGFFHPLDGIKNWNRLYGKKGFLQYQFLVPESDEAVENIKTILKKIQDKGLFSFLAVIKYHGPHRGFLSFSDDGFSVALDFPNIPEVHSLLDEIDEFLCTIGGRVYLAKDARLKPANFEKMYGDVLPEWRKIIREVNPKHKIYSSMARRLGF